MDIASHFPPDSTTGLRPAAVFPVIASSSASVWGQQQQPQNRMPTEVQYKKLMYVVQRCWHSGPKQYNPVDLLRLFHTQREAEEAAFHSAKAFQNNSGFKDTKAPQHNNPFVNTWNNNSDGVCATEAYAILTEGIIGGTGNRNSRRGTETCDGRVFGGDAIAYSFAKDAVAPVKANLTNFTLMVELKTLPIGKPTEFSYTTGDFLNDWPTEVILERPDNGFDVTTATNNKRQNDHGNNSGGDINGSAAFDSCWGRTVSGNTSMTDSITHENEEEIENVDGDIVVDCPFEQPTAKRRRTNIEETSATTLLHNGNNNYAGWYSRMLERTVKKGNSDYGNHLGMQF
ncbi:hypothetical protein FRACYDRAFT_241118 [Fragilariopsis cylindrus CCMP1102]|uniref:Uncharacterized protein n=1 Tax=Fragilariopsis cylindrus CCMP1102 TaxID=635003 RepID=A0A1E7F8R9_9STRA|nr:hypothetical protein FRACYDRAFT_241118 [Fragilariopsis cylindrus CCMP1102]|eukprot:OEU14570.1 hypothetical protein FRACYDRAFT_241118 [Fragilariopsis cylindrus CCMP1102]